MKHNRQDSIPSGRIGRRIFVQAALGTQVAGACSAFQGNAPRQARNGKSYRETFETPIVAHHQVIVAGGGPSGVIAAIASARSGADTLLVERYAFLGGNGTAGLMTCYNGFRNQRPPEALQTVKGIPAEYIAELVRLGGIADIDSYERTVQHDIKKGDILRATYDRNSVQRQQESVKLPRNQGGAVGDSRQHVNFTVGNVPMREGRYASGDGDATHPGAADGDRPHDPDLRRRFAAAVPDQPAGASH